MKKNWNNPQMLNLEIKETNTAEGVYYVVSGGRGAGVQCTGVIRLDGTVVQACSEKFFGVTVDEAVAKWYEHCKVAHAGHAAYGEFLGHFGISG